MDREYIKASLLHCFDLRLPETDLISIETFLNSRNIVINHHQNLFSRYCTYLHSKGVTEIRNVSHLLNYLNLIDRFKTLNDDLESIQFTTTISTAPVSVTPRNLSDNPTQSYFGLMQAAEAENGEGVYLQRTETVSSNAPAEYERPFSVREMTENGHDCGQRRGSLISEHSEYGRSNTIRGGSISERRESRREIVSKSIHSLLENQKNSGL